jgi:TatD DNase family protein
VTSSISPSIQKVKNIVDRYPKYVYWALGLHPPGVNNQSVRATIKLIQKYASEIVAIGEVGLDYYWVKEKEKRNKQKEAFKEFISLAKTLGKPIVIHARDAQSDTIDILEEMEASEVLMHCFSGSEEEAKRVLQNEWFISVPTSVVNRKVHQRMAQVVPLKQMLLETDAPYLSPVRKTRNEPANIKLSAEKIGELKNSTFEEVAQKTTRNAKAFYKLDC